MCIIQTLKKFRTQTCNVTNPLHNVSNSFNSSKLCNGNEEHFPWYRPELDTYNQNHMLYFSSETALEEINATDYYFPNTLWIVAEPTEIIVKTALFIPLVLWGILGNVALLYVIMKYRHLRSPTNMIIANMATVDLASLVIYPWVFLVCDFFQNYQLSHFGCKVDGWLEFSLLMINVINLSVISYDRLSAIVLPHETRLTREGAKIVIVVSWIVSLIVASPLMIYRQYKKRQWKDFLEIYCTENTVVISIYWHILLVLVVWIPSVLLMICYIAIFVKLDRYEQKVLKREHPLSVCYKTKVAKILFIVVITFVLCRTPFTVLIFRRSQWLKLNIQNQVLDADHILWFVARYLLYMNAALDPLIYGLMNENFRRAFRTTGFTKIFFPKKKKPQITEKLCVNVIQPRGPYKTEQKSDAWLIGKSKNSFENKSDDSSQTKNVVFHS